MAAAVLWLFWRRRETDTAAGRHASALLMLALLNNVIPFILFAEAQREITGGLGSILNATTPIWGVIVAHVFTADERATPGKVVGVTLGFAGVAVTMGVGSLHGIGGSAVAQLECLVNALYALAELSRRFKTMGVHVGGRHGPVTAGHPGDAAARPAVQPPWRAGCRRPRLGRHGRGPWSAPASYSSIPPARLAVATIAARNS